MDRLFRWKSHKVQDDVSIHGTCVLMEFTLFGYANCSYAVIKVPKELD